MMWYLQRRGLDISLEEKIEEFEEFSIPSGEAADDDDDDNNEEEAPTEPQMQFKQINPQDYLNDVPKDEL